LVSPPYGVVCPKRGCGIPKNQRKLTILSGFRPKTHRPVASTVDPSAHYLPPPVNFGQGDLVIAVIASATDPGLFEVYAENTTGKEPLSRSDDGAARGAVGGGWQPEVGDNPTNATTSQLLRFTTRDFVTYSSAVTVLALAKGGTPTMKSMARSDDGSLYVLFTVSVPFQSCIEHTRAYERTRMRTHTHTNSHACKHAHTNAHA
jgi:hypothetical protein